MCVLRPNQTEGGVGVYSTAQAAIADLEPRLADPGLWDNPKHGASVSQAHHRATALVTHYEDALLRIEEAEVLMGAWLWMLRALACVDHLTPRWRWVLLRSHGCSCACMWVAQTWRRKKATQEWWTPAVETCMTWPSAWRRC